MDIIDDSFSSTDSLKDIILSLLRLESFVFQSVCVSPLSFLNADPPHLELFGSSR